MTKKTAACNWQIAVKCSKSNAIGHKTAQKPDKNINKKNFLTVTKTMASDEKNGFFKRLAQKWGAIWQKKPKTMQPTSSAANRPLVANDSAFPAAKTASPAATQKMQRPPSDSPAASAASTPKIELAVFTPDENPVFSKSLLKDDQPTVKKNEKPIVEAAEKTLEYKTKIDAAKIQPRNYNEIKAEPEETAARSRPIEYQPAEENPSAQEYRPAEQFFISNEPAKKRQPDSAAGFSKVAIALGTSKKRKRHHKKNRPKTSGARGELLRGQSIPAPAKIKKITGQKPETRLTRGKSLHENAGKIKKESKKIKIVSKLKKIKTARVGPKKPRKIELGKETRKSVVDSLRRSLGRQLKNAPQIVERETVIQEPRDADETPEQAVVSQPNYSFDSAQQQQPSVIMVNAPAEYEPHRFKKNTKAFRTGRAKKSGKVIRAPEESSTREKSQSEKGSFREMLEKELEEQVKKAPWEQAVQARQTIEVRQAAQVRQARSTSETKNITENITRNVRTREKFLPPEIQSDSHKSDVDSVAKPKQGTALSDNGKDQTEVNWETGERQSKSELQEQILKQIQNKTVISQTAGESPLGISKSGLDDSKNSATVAVPYMPQMVSPAPVQFSQNQTSAVPAQNQEEIQATLKELKGALAKKAGEAPTPISSEQLEQFEQRLSQLLEQRPVSREHVMQGIASIDSSRVIEGFTRLSEILEHELHGDRRITAEEEQLQMSDLVSQKKDKKKMVGIEKTLEKKELITDFDKILEIVRQKGQIKLSELTVLLKMDKNAIKEACDILEENNLVHLEFPPIGEPRVVDINFEKQKNKKNVKETKAW